MVCNLEHIKIAREKFEAYDSNVWIKDGFPEMNIRGFYEGTGGFIVHHKEHKFSKACGGGDAEKEVGCKLAEYNGKQVEFLAEGVRKGPDIMFDCETWDIKYIDYANENTIRKYMLDARKANNAIFYWKTNERLSDLRCALRREIGRLIKGQIKMLPSIYYIDNKGLLTLLWTNEKGTT